MRTIEQLMQNAPWVKNASAAHFSGNIEELTISNTLYRKVLFTTLNSQLVLMSIPKGEDIGEETHDGDQFFRFEKGEGTIIIAGNSIKVSDGSSAVVPRKVKHNVVNTGNKPLQLYAIYSPPQHQKDTVHKTKADEVEDHFDGKTSLTG